MANLLINDVSDTALWVAHYRALENERSDALFRDPFAKVLVGERGRKIAESMESISRMTSWTIVIRTCIIDHYIEELISLGIDTVINLGAGLDTRPYRMKLPSTFHWIEADYPHMIEMKEKLLAQEKPHCHLEQVKVDLADETKRRAFFTEMGARCKKALVLTEGVIPYLTEEQVASLATDLHAQENFHFWITEYFTPSVYRYFKSPARMKKMKNAPFQFFPKEWLDFFAHYGWKVQAIRYSAEEGAKLGRPMPLPLWARLLRPFVDEDKFEEHRRFSGYALFGKASATLNHK